MDGVAQRGWHGPWLVGHPNEESPCLCSGCVWGSSVAGRGGAGQVPGSLGSRPSTPITASLYDPGQSLKPLCASASSPMAVPDLSSSRGRSEIQSRYNDPCGHTPGKVLCNIVLVASPAIVSFFQEYQALINWLYLIFWTSDSYFFFPVYFTFLPPRTGWGWEIAASKWIKQIRTSL